MHNDGGEDITPLADCRDCSFRGDLLPSGRCTPGDRCVAIHSGRQIDRFFRQNPQLAVHYLADPFWERRAIAVRYAPVEALLPMIHDVDEAVRRAVAYRLPRERLGELMRDPDREVRITVADRLPAEQLEWMATDPDYLVRAYVVQRIAPGRLFRFIRDEDRQVRKFVAQRLPEESLGLMVMDPNRRSAAWSPRACTARTSWNCSTTRLDGTPGRRGKRPARCPARPRRRRPRGPGRDRRAIGVGWGRLG